VVVKIKIFPREDEGLIGPIKSRLHLEKEKSGRTFYKGMEERRSLPMRFFSFITRPHKFIGIMKDKRPIITISYDLKINSFSRKMATNISPLPIKNVCGGRFMSGGQMEKAQYNNVSTKKLDKKCIGK
jgi:hypothetical protein